MTTEITKQEMIDKIYEVIADKTRNMWCKIWRYEDEHSDKLTIWTYINSYVPDEYTCNPRIELFNWKIIVWDWDYDYETIWNPVMIWDILDWMWNALAITPDDIRNLILEWEYKREKIEDQSEECISFIYNLCK